MTFIRANGNSDTGTNTVTTTINVAAGSDRMLVIGVAAVDTGGPPAFTAVDFDPGGGDEVAATNIVDNGAGEILTTSLYYILEADLPASGTYDVTMTHDGSGECFIGVSLYEDVDQTPTLGTPQSEYNDDDPYTSPTVTGVDGDTVVDVYYTGKGGSTTSQTERVAEESIGGGPSSGYMCEVVLSGGTTTTFGYDNDASGPANLHAWGAVAVGPAAAGGEITERSDTDRPLLVDSVVRERLSLVSQGLLIGDSVDPVKEVDVAITDPFLLDDITDRERFVQALAREGFLLDDTSGRERFMQALAREGFLLDDASGREWSAQHQATDAVLLGDAADQARVAQQLAADPVLVADTTGRARLAQQLASDAPLLGDAAERARLAQVLGSDAPLLVDATVRERLVQLLATDAPLLGEVTASAKLSEHLASDGLLLEAIVYRLREHQSTLGLLLDDSVDPAKTGVAVRDLIDRLLLDDSVDPQSAGIVLRAETDGVFMLSADLRDMRFTHRQGLFLDDASTIQGIRQHRTADGLFLDDRAVRLRELVTSIGLLLWHTDAAEVAGAPLARAEIDRLVLGDHVLREILLTSQSGLLVDQRLPLQTLRQRRLDDGLFLRDHSNRLRELVASIGLFLRDVDARDITESNITDRLLSDGLFLLDQAVKLVELRQRAGVLVADARLSTLDRALADGTLFAEQQGLLREVVRIGADGLLVPDARSSILDAILTNRLLLDDTALAQYFPELIEALIGVGMDTTSLIGARGQASSLIGHKSLTASLLGALARIQK